MTIKVTLDANNAVCVDPSIKVKKREGKKTHVITWVKGPQQNFEFIKVEIEAPAGVFEEKENNGVTIVYKNHIAKGSEKIDYYYDVTVKTPDGKHHTGPKPKPKLEGGRAVIRNEP